MKTIILAGGFGTRFSEYTIELPKPLIEVGGKPIIWHIMNCYAQYGHKDFYIALGYKGEKIKSFFLNYQMLNSDFRIDLKKRSIEDFNQSSLDWKVSLIDTGLNTLTGGRAKKISKFIGNETCMLTYGDGLSNVNIEELIKFHKNHGKMITMTAVRPSARFGELILDGDQVKNFEEKPQLYDGWINGGFFVIEPEFFKLIKDDNIMLEREPLSEAVKADQLMCYRHDGFWQCMDSKRDHELLESLCKDDTYPWLK
tara:strand:+ start:610 stop:1374 length:765 start_codon:yes stop_codon:yes gene_type:complete